MPRLISQAVFAAILLLVGQTKSQADEIALFDYHGDAVEFEQVVGLLAERLANLQPEIFQDVKSMPPDAGRLSAFKVTRRGLDTLANTDEALQWINNQGDVLGVLQGTILSGTGAPLVFSRFTLPDAIPAFGSRVITIKTEINGDEFANNRDGHTLMMLYCLLQDARRNNLDRAYINALASAAHNTIINLSRRWKGHLPSDIRAIQRDVESSLTGARR
ncbi:hypothetical protein GYN07_29530 (plasmid) [Rhizobium leguminosarum bv. viciae 248]|uniref:hypothetical protein n=1 Tax=Rhizobium leguminosarum TaxID=384 RepID=UPI0003818F1B|nr:hypothetical protein [Rhizobium leguminosarum]MCA2407033.1 hypothetical protein [Rhizobium leguminosarum]NKM60736.1 hypothetical protein [Rhizobium leguminosarum bv. viciae]QHW28464.1 hypothetical protein GYN07_29530 [Rhizobium leguminosarum bv. viciae 248]